MPCTTHVRPEAVIWVVSQAPASFPISNTPLQYPRNLVNMETAQYGPDQGIKAVATDWCLLIVSILLLSARLYAATFIEGDRVTRKCNWRRLTWDDYFMVAATVRTMLYL